MFLRPSFVSGVRRPHLDRFYIERIQKTRLYTDKAFHSLVSHQRLATWSLGPIPSAETLAHEITTRRHKLFLFFILFLLLYIFLFLKLTSFLLGMVTMKENKGKEVVDEGVKSHPCPPTAEKRKNISSRVDLGDLPSRRGREKKHKSSKSQDIKSPPASNLKSSVQVLALDPEPKGPPSKKISSIIHEPTSSTPSKEVPQHLLGNEDLAWERFSTVVMDMDMGAYYNMSLKDFEHSGVHDLFKVSFYIYIYIYISRP